MRHVWLAFVVLAAIAGEARAKRAPNCYCATTITRPEPNQAAPANTKVWVIDPTYGAVHTSTRVPTADVFGVRVFDVIPGESYKNPRTGVELIPGRDRDDDAPSAPLDAVVSIVMNKYDLRSDVESLAVHGTFSPDTVFVRVDIKDADGFVSLLLPHNALSSCDPGFTLTGRQLTVELRSIDLAGNESPPYVAKVELVTTFSSGDFDCRGRHGEWRYGHRGHGFEILGLLFLWFAYVVGWVVVVVIRRLTAKRSPAEPVAHLEAEEVVRRMTRWLLVWSAMLLLAIIGLHSLGKEETSIYAFCLAPFAFSAIGRLWIAHRARRLLDKPEADAVRHGRWLCVTTLRDSVLLRAEDIDFVVARHRSIPRSVVK